MTKRNKLSKKLNFRKKHHYYNSDTIPDTNIQNTVQYNEIYDKIEGANLKNEVKIFDVIKSVGMLGLTIAGNNIVKSYISNQKRWYEKAFDAISLLGVDNAAKGVSYTANLASPFMGNTGIAYHLVSNLRNLNQSSLQN
jgi:hypothetical protein